MSYCIQVPENRGKPKQLVTLYNAVILTGPPVWSEVPRDKAVICVVDNGQFEAAGFCYSHGEFERLNSPDRYTFPSRPRTWLLMDSSLAEELSGFKQAG